MIVVITGRYKMCHMSSAIPTTDHITLNVPFCLAWLEVEEGG